ncbi:hypothetical protein [Microbacterium sp.]|uniref:hypothetical protein n=1 Tax=Microbacterium sp. TaxID=51671 RepID=UPI002810AB5A|nr:hypothetical protein [Microbacterium sp.]
MTSAGPTAARRDGRPLLSLTIGVVAALLGLIPGLIGGGRLPLQNLWATQTLPEDMPFALLPVSQYYATSLLALLLIGGVLAGLGIRWANRRVPVAVWPAAAGVALVHAIAIMQTFGVLALGLGLGSGGARAALYFGGMLGGTVIAALLAQVGLRLTSRASVGPVALGVALAAVPLVSWVSYGVNAVTGPITQPPLLVELVRWLPAVIVGLALAWCGVQPLRRLGVWAAGLLALWLLPALFVAAQYGLGMRVLQGDIVEMAGASAQLFPLVLAEGGMPVLVAAVIGVVGVVVRAVASPQAPEAAVQAGAGPAAGAADGPAADDVREINTAT